MASGKNTKKQVSKILMGNKNRLSVVLPNSKISPKYSFQSTREANKTNIKTKLSFRMLLNYFCKYRILSKFMPNLNR